MEQVQELNYENTEKMKIVLSGVSTVNKGAELMLYAILQEISHRFPNAEVYIPYNLCKQRLEYIKTNLKLKYTPYSRLAATIHLEGVLNHLHLSQKLVSKTNIVNEADWFIDGSGFAFSDQFNIKFSRVEMWQGMLSQLYADGCKIVFLPQAYGPLEKPNTRKLLSVINEYANVIMPRERTSYEYLAKSSIIDMNKVRLFTDFTSLVKGVFPIAYEHLKGGICIIPNLQMIRKGKISYDSYIRLLTAIIMESKKSSSPVYLLNHEGKKDEELCYKCQKSIGGDIEVVTNLNALEVKGLISSAYLVITSRFHGLASALNSYVPSLATSWSHKYEELYRDYGITDSVLPLDNIDKALEKVEQLLDKENNANIRSALQKQVPKIMDQTREMWNIIWSLKA